MERVKVRGHIRERKIPFTPMPKLKPKRHLEYRTFVIVPSTEYENKISQQKFQRRIQETRKFLSSLFGGYTSISARGGWLKTLKDKKHKRLVVEKAVQVIAYADKGVYEKKQRELLKWLKKKKKQWKQYTLSYGFEDDLYLL